MGFALAPLLAVLALGYNVRAAGCEAEGRVVHGAETPLLTRERPVWMPYLAD